MKKIKVGINGMGRIGRTILREWAQRTSASFDVVAINNPGDLNEYVHLLKYDSLHGKFPNKISLDGNLLSINNHKMKFYNFMDPKEIPWDKDEVDLVIDGTGIFKDKEGLSKHIKGKVKKVLMCAPGKGLDGTFVMGINHTNYDHNKHHFVSNASCTTNCLAPIAKVLNDQFGIETGLMTTIHSYTGDQRLLDANHSDLRRARAAALSMIPTSTGAAKALGEVIPELKGKLDGYAVRVPTPDVSIVDLTVTLHKSASIQEINQAMKTASQTTLKGILGYSEESLVSIDYMGAKESSIFDPELTNVIGKTAKVISWYDNEVGFSNRVIDLTNYMAEKF